MPRRNYRKSSRPQRLKLMSRKAERTLIALASVNPVPLSRQYVSRTVSR